MEKVYRNSITSLPKQALISVLKEMGEPPFRAAQVFTWLHEKRVTAFGQMNNLPAGLRAKLAQMFCIDAPSVVQEQVSQDGTRKFLLQLADENCVEMVLMQYKHGNSLCISSQVGCRMGCKFCASTQGGLVRGLTAGEMLAQVYTAVRHTGVRVSHVVLMGIGEPLDNFDAVIDFIEMVTSEEGMNLSVRGISLSTSGLVPAIKKLAQKKLGITLSVSLHAANNKTRSSMMPVNDTWPLEQLIPACKEYQITTGRRVSFEYAMVRGVNDSQKDAQQLAQLLQGMRAHTNLIPVNPVDGLPFGPSDSENIAAFKNHLQNMGLNATVRRRLGTDISAACGQLRLRAAGTGEVTE